MILPKTLSHGVKISLFRLRKKEMGTPNAARLKIIEIVRLGSYDVVEILLFCWLQEMDIQAAVTYCYRRVLISSRGTSWASLL